MRKVTANILAGFGVVLLVAGACGKSASDRSAEAAAESRSENGEDAEKQNKQKSAEAGTEEKSGGSELPLEATGPVAVVDGEEIGADEFNEIIETKFGGAGRPLPRAMAEQMKSKIVSSLVDKHLIERELESADVEASEEEVQKEVKRFKERLPNPEAYEKFLERRGMSEEEFKERIRKDVKLKNLLRDRQGIEVTEEEARKHYDDNIDRYKEPEKVKARHILIKAEGEADEKEAKKRAKELAEKARKEGTDFAELAREHSEGPSASKGGDLGSFARDRMVDAFADKAFSMKEGEISDPVQTKFGYHVIKHEGHKEASTESFDSVKEDIVSKLERKKFRNAVDQFVAKLREDAEITEKPDNVQVNAPERSGGMMKGGGLKGKKLKQQLKKKLKKQRKKKKQQQNERESGEEE